MKIPGLQSQVRGVNVGPGGQLTPGAEPEAPDFSPILKMVMSIREHEQKQQAAQAKIDRDAEYERQKRLREDEQLRIKYQREDEKHRADRELTMMRERPTALQGALQLQDMGDTEGAQRHAAFFGLKLPPQVPGGVNVPGAGVVYPGLVPKFDLETATREVSNPRNSPEVKARWGHIAEQLSGQKFKTDEAVAEAERRKAEKAEKQEAVQVERFNTVYDQLAAPYIKEQEPITPDLHERLVGQAERITGYVPKGVRTARIMDKLSAAFPPQEPATTRPSGVRPGKMY